MKSEGPPSKGSDELSFCRNYYEKGKVINFIESWLSFLMGRI